LGFAPMDLLTILPFFMTTSVGMLITPNCPASSGFSSTLILPKIETTEKTRNFMAVTFDNAEWATRDPQVLRGTTVTADNYWKGIYDHQNALLITETYGCPDPYALTEMEDVALTVVMDRLGMLDRMIIIRDSVNMDVFMNGATPESLWDPNFDHTLASESSVEAADIFATAMENNFKVGSVVVNAILDGTL